MFFLPLFYFGIITEGVIGLSDRILSDKKYTWLHYGGDGEVSMCPTSTCFELESDIQQDMNKYANPCNDFYEYTCGNWRKGKSTDELTWSMLDPILYKTFRRIHELLIEKNEYDKISFIKIAKKYHRACINEDAIKDQGLKPIKLLLNSTGGWPILMSNVEWYKKNYTWQTVNNIYSQLYGLNNFVNLYYVPDVNNKSRNILMVDQSLTNPFDEMLETLENETYRCMQVDLMFKIIHIFKDEGKHISIRKLRADIDAVIRFHRNLTKISKNNKIEQIRTTREMTIAELQNFYDLVAKQPSGKINWLDMIQFIFKDVDVNINASEPILVDNQDGLHNLARLLDATPSHVIVNYIQWNIMTQFMQYLNEHKIQREYDYLSSYNEIEEEERWLTCVKNSLMPDIAAYIFIKRYISADILKTVSEMINEIKAEFKERILFSPWLRNNTKMYMIDRINRLTAQIGYPSGYDNQTKFFKRYKGLAIGDYHIENLLTIIRYDRRKSLKAFRTRKRISKKTIDWLMNPVGESTMYNAELHQIFISASLVRDPYFMPDTPLAVSYGLIGTVIAHELTHSCGWEIFGTIFERDRRGRKILHIGDKTAFTQRSMCFVDQYNNYMRNMTNGNKRSVTDGHRTMDENIADFVGMEAAFAVFKKKKASVKSQRRLPTLMKISDEQLFFLSLANIMCTTVRDVDDNPLSFLHGSAKFRTNGPLANMASFSEAFNCPLDSPMNPKSKCKIWN